MINRRRCSLRLRAAPAPGKRANGRAPPILNRERTAKQVGETDRSCWTSDLGCGSLAGQSLGPQPFTIFIKRLLRDLMVAHGFLGLDPPSSIARLALFRGQGFASEGKIFCHGEVTRR